MTNEDFLKAKQIKKDLEALKDLTISVGASKELIDSWKNWANGEIDRLSKEFDELWLQMNSEFKGEIYEYNKWRLDWVSQ